MAVNGKGELVKSVYDDCVNYSPNKTAPIQVICVKFGVLYECLNFAQKHNKERHCSNCSNRKE